MGIELAVSSPSVSTIIILDFAVEFLRIFIEPAIESMSAVLSPTMPTPKCLIIFDDPLEKHDVCFLPLDFGFNNHSIIVDNYSTR